jgi:hypothetical protein
LLFTVSAFVLRRRAIIEFCIFLRLDAENVFKVADTSVA